MSASGLTAYRGGVGEPLVLLHGATFSWRVWDKVIPQVRERHEVFAPTLPGHRGSERFVGDLGNLVDAACGRLDAEGSPPRMSRAIRWVA